jgi:acetolactate synthase I/II/III large subunit
VSREITTGEALLRRLKTLGIDYLFANSGTDFPPLIEALAGTDAEAMPQPLVMPHEHAAMGMAHGYTQATGRPQAVMVHTNVGLANAAIGALNAAYDQIPMILCSGRTPATEHGRLGSRSNPINWGQEMRDQAALVREAVKWDYELRFPEQVYDVVDRAWAIAMSEPRGPVYLSLPREVLSAPCPPPASGPALVPAQAGPAAEDVARAAAILATAERPLVIAQQGAGGPDGFATLARLAERWAIPVTQFWPLQLAIASDHAMNGGHDPAPWLAEADAVLVINALTPWAPSQTSPPPDCKVIHIGPDPLFARYPIRGHRADATVTGNVATILAALEAEMGAPVRAGWDGAAEGCRNIRAAVQAKAEAGNRSPMTKAWTAKCVSDLLAEHDSVLITELGCPTANMTLTRADAFFQEPHSGGLGWGFPAALGRRLAEPERLVVATVGDGSYIFANPVACHQIAEALALPILLVVLNNGAWNAVRRATLDIFPDGNAARANAMPLTSLSPSPDFAKLAEAHRAWSETVEVGSDLPAALARAAEVVLKERRLALLEVRVS